MYFHPDERGCLHYDIEYLIPCHLMHISSRQCISWLFTGILAVSLPFVDSIIALAGTFLSAPLQFIFPSAIILLTWSQQNRGDARCAAYSVIQGDCDSAQSDSLSRYIQQSYNFQWLWLTSCDLFRKCRFNRFLHAGNIVIALVLGVVTVILGLSSTISSIKRNYELSSASSSCRGGANFSAYHHA